MREVTNEFIRMLAAVNGLTIPDERLNLVRRQYESFLRTLADIDTLPLTREAQPAVLSLVPVEPTARKER